MQQKISTNAKSRKIDNVLSPIIEYFRISTPYVTGNK